MNKNHTIYTSEELLQDDYFIQSAMHPTPESEAYWESLIAEGSLGREEYRQARFLIRAVQKPHKIMSAGERGALWAAIEIKNKEKLKKGISKRNYYLMGTAASFFLVVLAFIYLHLKPFDSYTDWAARMNQTTGGVSESNNIQLIIPGDRAYTVEEERAEITLSEEGKIHVNFELLTEGVRQPDKKKKKEITYNQLITPRGKHSRLTLPDGTRMHINSGTRVVFPQRFQGDKREIYVDGEVFLDVVPDKEMPFIVRTDNMEIEVLGTSFNVSAYQEEEEQAVVLVSGSVTVSSGNNTEVTLLPSQMITYTGEEHVVFDVDVSKHIAWKDGYLLCEKEDLHSVLKRLARYYGIDIICDPAVMEFTGNGKLDLKEDLDRVLNGLAKIFPIEIIRNEKAIHIVKKYSNI